MYSPSRYLLVMFGVFLIGFTALWIFTANFRMAFLDTGYGEWSAKLSMIRKCDTGSVVILGDSRAAAAYTPKLLGFAAKNLALSGSTAVEAYFELREILACSRAPQAIVLSFAPIQFEEIDWLWVHAVSYGQLSFYDLQDVANSERALHRTELYRTEFGAEPSPSVKNWLYANHFPPYDFSSLLGAIGQGRTAKNLAFERETLTNDGQHIVGTPLRCAPAPSSEVGRARFRVDPMIAIYLRRLLLLAREKQVRVIFGPTAISHMTSERIDPRYREEFVEFVHGLREQFSEVEVFDELLFVMDDCMFGDAHHLNAQGSEAFSIRWGRDMLNKISGSASDR